MSHIVSIQTQVTDPEAIRLACQRLQLPLPVQGTAKLFSAEATGWQVSLPGWRYPLVCEVESGKLHYDNFNERWGKTAELHRFTQAYAAEKAKLEARRAGLSVSEQQLTDGSIKLTIQVQEQT